MSPDEPQDPALEPRPAVPRAAPLEHELAPPPVRRWRGPVGWVLNDAGLKALALILAVMMWQLVRGQVEMTDTVENVTVEVRDLPIDLRIVGGNQRLVSLTLSGPAGDVRRVKAELVRTQSPIVFRLEDVTGAHGETGSVTNPKKFAYPVEGAAEVVSQINPPLRFEWYRVRDVEVRVGDPELAPIPGRSDVELLSGSIRIEEPRTVRVTGPIEVVEPLAAPGAVLPLDPVDASRWVEQDLDPTTAFSWESGFDRWRGKDELKLDDLLTIEPARVKGTLRLRFVKTEPVENALVLLFPPGTGREDYAGWDWEISATGGAYDAARRTLRLGFSAEARVIEELKAKPGQWAFAATLPPPPKEGEKVPTNERVAVVFLWLRPEPAPAARLDGGPNVFITLKRKPG